MNVNLEHNGKNYKVDLNTPIDISIPFSNNNTPIAWGAPKFSASPFESDGFIGSLEAGAPVNFFDVKINPHGNGTHTESAKHISRRAQPIKDALKNFHFIAQLITVKPDHLSNGDKCINDNVLEINSQCKKNIEALIIRTKPNTKRKLTRNYTGKNPPYLSGELMQQIVDLGVQHLLIDLPSVDREHDDGKLNAHHIFWNVKKRISNKKTISEMVYIDNKIKDGLYLLNLQVLAFDLDVSPSRPVLYQMVEI